MLFVWRISKLGEIGRLLLYLNIAFIFHAECKFKGVNCQRQLFVFPSLFFFFLSFDKFLVVAVAFGGFAGSFQLSPLQRLYYLVSDVIVGLRRFLPNCGGLHF